MSRLSLHLRISALEDSIDAKVKLIYGKIKPLIINYNHCGYNELVLFVPNQKNCNTNVHFDVRINHPWIGIDSKFLQNELITKFASDNVNMEIIPIYDHVHDYYQTNRIMYQKHLGFIIKCNWKKINYTKSCIII